MLFAHHSLLIVSALLMGALSPLKNGGAWRKVQKALGLVILIYGAVLIIGAGMGHSDPLRPLHNHQAHQLTFKNVKSVDDV